MANDEHVEILFNGVDSWNQWRESNKNISPDLSTLNLTSKKGKLLSLAKGNFNCTNFTGANLHRADLSGADLSGADLIHAKLKWANLCGADLRMANLSSADLRKADLSGADLGGADLKRANLSRAFLRDGYLARADLSDTNLIYAKLENAILSDADLIHTKLSRANLNGADLRRANLSWADLSRTNISGANLVGADLLQTTLRNANLNGSNLEYARIVGTNFSGANLSNCRVFGVSAWGIKLDSLSLQTNLRITPDNEPNITVDNLEVAQFVYLLLQNEKIRCVIDTIGQKGVLILGRFTEERKEVLDAIRNKLRELNYLPMMFDFEKPTQRDFTETINTLAGMCRFIISDITNPKSSPLELQATVPDYMIPFLPIIQENETPFSMFVDLQNKYDWVLDVLKYDTVENLIKVFDDAVIKPALEKAEELCFKKAKKITEKHVSDYM